MDSEDLYALFRKILEFAGLAKNEYSNNQRLSKFLAYYVPIAIIVYFIFFLLNIFEENTLIDKLESLQCLVSLVHLMAKVINLKYRKEKYKALLNDTLTVWREMAAVEENEQILMETKKSIDNVIKWIMGLFVMTPFLACATTFLKNLILQPEVWQLPYNVCNLVSVTLGKEYYFSQVAFLLQGFGQTLFVFGAVYCAYIVPCMMATGQMRVLGRMMSGKDLDIQESIQLHQKNIKLVKDITEMMCGQMFIEIVLSALHISLRCYQMIMVFKTFDARFFDSVFFLCLCFCGPYCVCLCGQMITDAKEKLYRDMYQNDWYNFSLKDSKHLSIMMSCASMNLKLEYRHILAFDMARLAMVMQTTYSYITIIVNYT